MDDGEKIMEKRSSFRGWKERNKGRIPQKINIIGILVIVVIFSALIIYPYWNKADNPSAKDKKKISTPIKKVNSSDSNKNSSLKTINKTNATKKTVNMTNTSKKNVIGKIGIPLVNNGFSITIKSVTPTSLYINTWISIKNIENKEKQFKLGPGTILIDSIGQQYENIKIARSAEISQTNLSALSIREGAIFFERLKEGRSMKKLILNINDEKVEFILNMSGSTK